MGSSAPPHEARGTSPSDPRAGPPAVTKDPRPSPPLRVAVRTGLRVVAAHWQTWLRAGVTFQLLTALVAGPVIALLLRAALRAAGVPALTEASLGQVLRDPVAVLLLLLLAVVATSAALLQHAAFVLLARELTAGRTPRLRDLAGQGAAAVRRAAGPQLAVLALYLLVVAPLGGFALGASLVRALEVPAFVASELHKTPVGTAAWLSALVLLWYLNLRLVLLPTAVLACGRTPAAAVAASWRVTRRRVLPLAVATGILWLLAALGVTALAAGAVAVTRVTDALWPAASPVAAGVALALAQGALVVGGGLVAAVVAVALLRLVSARPLVTGAGAAPATVPQTVAVVVAGALVTGAAVVAAAGLTAVDPEQTTLVIAHRGVTDDAVENTIESLEAAARLGVDVVELDVLQAADGGLVVVHDTNLTRLAGIDEDVADLTTAQLTATTVRQAGHESTIPSFAAFAARAAELDVPLLVEIKEHGREHGDLVGDVVAVLEAHGLAGTSYVQALDPGTVTELESRFPDLRTGSVVAILRGRLDAGAADFLTLEQGSYSPGLLRQAHTAGVQVFVWTVTDARQVRVLTRGGVDGLITSVPGTALEQRDAVAAESSVSDRLADAVRDLVS